MRLLSLPRSLTGKRTPALDPDIEEAGRKRLMVVFLSILIVLFVYFGITHVTLGILHFGIVNLLTAAVLFGFILALGRMRRGLALYRAVAVITWLLFFYWMYTGVFDGYASIWVVTYPIFVFNLLGKKEGSIWTASILAMCLYIFINPGGLLASFEYSPLFVQRHIGTMLIIILFTYNYESMRQQYKTGMENERAELRRHKERLEELVSERTEEIRAKNRALSEALEEREKMQSRLVQAQKMEALGTLAGGIAHDFNNLLVGIIGSFNMLEHIVDREKPHAAGDIRKYLSIGLESSKRSAELIKRLLTLSHEHELSLVPVDITVSIKNIRDICENSFPKSVLLDFRTPDRPMTVMADPVQIEQVLLNLCINASQAMTIMRRPGEKEGGTLSLTAEPCRAPDASAGPGDEASWLRIEVSDTGVGIDGEASAKIFDPFYTTKTSGVGTGLGLSISYSIVKQHNGFIVVRSKPGEGSIFSIYLPAADLAAEARRHVKKEERSAGTSGRILVVDDEKFILKISSGLLERKGWEVVTAESAEEALGIYAAQWRTIGAVLLDLSMPGISGLDLFLGLKEINPDVKAVLCSGMLDNEVRKAALEIGMRDTIHKPYDVEKLLDLIGGLMDA